MFLSDEERLAARPKISEVRELMNAAGSLNLNPFFAPLQRDALLDVFKELASDIERAGAKLAELTGENVPAWDGKGVYYLAGGFVAESMIKKTNVEVTLSEAFSRTATAPYFALRALETAEVNTGHYCPEKVREAMDGLVSLHTVAKAVPLVYEQISRAPAPVGAVA